MKQATVILILLAFFIQGCGLNEREKSLQKKQVELSQKEQQLLIWEQRLKIREQELNNAKQYLDSAKQQIDTTYNPLLIGSWTVKMTCTETTCDGSAIGDTKTERWEIADNGKNIIVKAYSGIVLIRVYTGSYKNKVVRITDEKPNSGVLISATLNYISDTRMDGLREINQKDCKIVYGLVMERAK